MKMIKLKMISLLSGLAVLIRTGNKWRHRFLRRKQPLF